MCQRAQRGTKMLVALLQPCTVELGASQFCSGACLCLSCSLPWAARAMLDPMGMRRSYVGDEVATHTARDGEIQLLLVCCCTHQPLAAPTRHPWVVLAMLMRRCSLTRSRMLLTSCCTPCRSHDPSCSLLGGNLGTVGPTRCSQAAAPHAGPMIHRAAWRMCFRDTVRGRQAWTSLSPPAPL